MNLSAKVHITRFPMPGILSGWATSCESEDRHVRGFWGDHRRRLVKVVLHTLSIIDRDLVLNEIHIVHRLAISGSRVVAIPVATDLRIVLAASGEGAHNLD